MDALTVEQRRLYERIPDAVDYVDSVEFDKSDAEERFFGEGSEIPVPAWTHFPEVQEEATLPRQKRVALKPGQETHLFLRYNYARRRLAEMIAQQKKRSSLSRAAEMTEWFTRVMKCRSALVRANMALVLAMAKRTRIPNVDFGEIVSEGNMALLRSIEKFNASLGFKFSTYACRAILKSFNRMATKTGRYRSHFPVEYDPEMERSDFDEKRHEIQRDNSVDALREILSQNRAHLTDVERKIVQARFALGTVEKKRTLAEVGKLVGLTNERVRQLQNSALAKIRAALDSEYLHV